MRSFLLVLALITAGFLAWPNLSTVSAQTVRRARPAPGRAGARRTAAARNRRCTTAPVSGCAAEMVFWESVRDSHDPADLNAYLERYGEDATFAVLAHNRLRALGALGAGAGNAVNSGNGTAVAGRRRLQGGVTGGPITIDFVSIAPATFTMGSPDNESARANDEGPQHPVTFAAGFDIGKYEITQGQWRSVMGTDPSKFGGCDECPVESVSWNDAQAFLAKLNARNDGFRYTLPTEAQFEYLMRGGTTGEFAGELDDLGWYFPNSDGKTRPVGQKHPNIYGIYDLHGNAQEWVQDAYTPDYDGAPADGSARRFGPDPIRRVIRGGSWIDPEKYFRSAFRVARPPDDRNEYTGFRVVRVPFARGAPANFPKFEFAAIAPAIFMMGSVESEAERDGDEGPRHEVRIARGFEMGKYEVTQAQWEAVMGSNPSKFAGCAQCPVDTVSWNDVQEFMAILNARNDGFSYNLPTEAQFEYVMRAGTTEAYAGDADGLGWYGPNSESKTHPVGQKAPNSFGLYDLHGNVQEWTQDAYAGDYNGAPTDGSARTVGDEPVRRVIRGGSWLDNQKYFRSAWRVSRPPDDRNEYDGFRLVRVPVR
jgi:formylglycine-generating enzyme required for sulfatase activity